MTRPVRVRIAPSPTGDPHVGTAYIALFNYVFAKQQGGTFLLRMEDTDQGRSTPESEKAILSALDWLGLSYDEGPFRQSERLSFYQEQAGHLIRKGYAYPCFCSSERLQALRATQREQGDSHQGYDGLCRNLDGEEAVRRAMRGEPYVVRMRIPEGTTRFVDGLRGEISFDNSTFDDQIILKQDGFPMYHLASVVDDHLMGITHVIRAEEWISSTPKHILLYRWLGWEPPAFYHLGLLRNPDHSKISKRKSPVSLDYYRREGILPEALLNFLGLLGFSMPGEQEKFSLDEMIQAFSWDRVKVGGPVFDLPKLFWLNGQYLRSRSPETLLPAWKALLPLPLLPDDVLLRILRVTLPRVDTLTSIAPRFPYLLSDPGPFPVVPAAKPGLEALHCHLAALPPAEWTVAALERVCDETTQALGWSRKQLLPVVRLALTQAKQTPAVWEILYALGKETSLRRLSLFC